MNDWMCEKSLPKGYWIWVWSTLSWNAAINATWSICTFLNATISTLSTRGKMGSESPKKGHQNAACMTDYSLFEKCLGIYFTISKKWKIPIFGKPNPIPHLTWLEGRPKHFCEVVSSTEKKRVSIHRRNHDCCVSSLNAGSARCSLHSTWLWKTAIKLLMSHKKIKKRTGLN